MKKLCVGTIIMKNVQPAYLPVDHACVEGLLNMKLSLERAQHHILHLHALLHMYGGPDAEAVTTARSTRHILGALDREISLCLESLPPVA